MIHQLVKRNFRWGMPEIILYLLSVPIIFILIEIFSALICYLVIVISNTSQEITVIFYLWMYFSFSLAQRCHFNCLFCATIHSSMDPQENAEEINARQKSKRPQSCLPFKRRNRANLIDPDKYVLDVGYQATLYWLFSMLPNAIAPNFLDHFSSAYNFSNPCCHLDNSKDFESF